MYFYIVYSQYIVYTIYDDAFASIEARVVLTELC